MLLPHTAGTPAACFAKEYACLLAHTGNRVAFAPSRTVLDSTPRTELRINEPVASRCICFGPVQTAHGAREGS